MRKAKKTRIYKPNVDQVTWTGNNFSWVSNFLNSDLYFVEFQTQGYFNLINLKTGDIRTYYMGVTFYKIDNIITVKLD